MIAKSQMLAELESVIAHLSMAVKFVEREELNSADLSIDAALDQLKALYVRFLSDLPGIQDATYQGKW